jgi:hypothetical protein
MRGEQARKQSILFGNICPFARVPEICSGLQMDIAGLIVLILLVPPL